jgi:hypothetical protein
MAAILELQPSLVCRLSLVSESRLCLASGLFFLPKLCVLDCIRGGGIGFYRWAMADALGNLQVRDLAEGREGWFRG